MSKTFDLIIPTWNNLAELKKCLQGFEGQSFRDFRALICVDGSTDGTIEYLESVKVNFEFEILKHAAGIHKGRNETRNLSLKKISSKYILLFDSDIVPQNDLLQKHFELFSKKDCVSLGEVVYKNANKNIWALYLQTRGKDKYTNLAEIPSHYLNTQNASFKSEYFIKLKGQDPELSNNYGGDDTILGYRIEKEFKIPVVFNKTAVGYSFMDKDLDQALRQMKEFGAINLKVIRRKYPSFTEIFRFDIVESRLLHYKIIRLFLRKWIANISQRMIWILPKFLKIKVVHFLVFYSIQSGYELGND